ncbi:MAG: hypothetical protein IPM42_12700 [Saprospiraceae bacterium]|nr:hypothetical protein [Saprospiraceae bacterium]
MTQLDRYFKNKLKNYSTDVPDEMWDRIESRLPQRATWDGKRLMLLNLIVLALILSAGTLSLITSTDNNISVDINKSQYNYKPTTFAHLTQKNDVNEVSNKAVADESNVDEKENTKVENSKSQTKTALKSVRQLQTSLDIRTHVGESIKYLKTGTKLTFDDKAIDDSYHSTDSDDHITSNFRIFKETVNLRNIHFQPTSRENAVLNNFKNKYNSHNYGSVCPSFQKAIKRFSLDVYGSQDFVTNKLKAKSPEALAYKSMRDLSESPLFSFSVGIRGGFRFDEHISLSAGVQYSEINEKFEYIDPESNQTRLVTIKDYVYQNGVIVDSIITQEVIVIPGTVEFTTYNKYRSLDIPILFNYEFLNFGRWSADVTAGPMVNITTMKKGMIISHINNDSPANISSGTVEADEIYKNNIGFSVYGGLSIHYSINHKWGLIIEPNVRYQLQSVTNTGYPLEQRYLTAGLMTGVKYNF